MPRILTVDDSATVRRLIRIHLKGMDLAIVEAENGAEGLKAMAKTQFDLMIVDLMMPVMDGAQLIAQVRADDTLRHIPIVAVSGGGPSARSAATSC